ncbi:MAG: hypothetical protein JO316_24370 [Abitibacteriaceae bacterium]|nr:hypothetical protein [Abditibacteriaceae bacterium]
MKNSNTLLCMLPALGLGVALLAFGSVAGPQSLHSSTVTSQGAMTPPVRIAALANGAIRPYDMVDNQVSPAMRAKYEPTRGAYLGAVLDFSGISTAAGANNREKMATVMRNWETQSGRKHAIYTQFIPFPHDDGSFGTWDSDPKGWASASDFCNAAADVGATPLLTLEPLTVDGFRTWQAGSPAYDATAAFAQAVGNWGKPIFIRFAHEMNGSWYPWAEWIDKNKNLRRDPGEDTGFTARDYRLTYRNVASLFRRYAPNAALVWCPNSGLLGGDRRDAFRPFYPGDDVVDWVGLDIYERGWAMPMPGAKLWAGQFENNLTHDAADDPKTQANESVDFYKIFVGEKKKPLMICETGTTLSYRNDLPTIQRAALNNAWKTGYWDDQEYGWLQGVYGTSDFKDQKLSRALDKNYPRIKAISWFQIAKHEDIPVMKSVNGKDQLTWFDNGYADYRIGGSVEENGTQTYAQPELDLYRRLTASPYFLSSVQK